MNHRTLLARSILLVALVLAPAAAVASDFDAFLAELDLRASKDNGAYRTDLSATFGVSSGKVDGLFRIATRPSDVYMCLRLGEVARMPVERVVEEYQRNGNKGWGVMAQNLGIKPGSDEFHALKAGRLNSRGGNSKPSANTKGKGPKH